MTPPEMPRASHAPVPFKPMLLPGGIPCSRVVTNIRGHWTTKNKVNDFDGDLVRRSLATAGEEADGRGAVRRKARFEASTAKLSRGRAEPCYAVLDTYSDQSLRKVIENAGRARAFTRYEASRGGQDNRLGHRNFGIGSGSARCARGTRPSGGHGRLRSTARLASPSHGAVLYPRCRRGNLPEC